MVTLIEPAAAEIREVWQYPDTPRVQDLRRRVRNAMEAPPVYWESPARIDVIYMGESLAVRKARAMALKLSLMPTDIWRGQLFLGSMTLEDPRVHYERSFPDYATEVESQRADELGMSIRSCFGHIVPDYPRLLSKGLRGIMADAQAQRENAQSQDELEFLESIEITLQAVIDYAQRLADRAQQEATNCSDPVCSAELAQMAVNLRQVPVGPAQTYWQALQSSWLLHMLYHATMNGNAMGRVDQYASSTNEPPRLMTNLPSLVRKRSLVLPSGHVTIRLRNWAQNEIGLMPPIIGYRISSLVALPLKVRMEPTP